MKSSQLLSAEPAGQPLLADDVLEFHAARLILLLKHAGISNRIEGLTKLAKLDFFVRYPQFFSAVSRKLGKQAAVAQHGVESSMVRFHYGPWDKRYYHVLAYLEAKALITVSNDGTRFVFTLTETGKTAAKGLTEDDSFREITDLMKAVKETFGKGRWSGTRLKELVYENFKDEVASRSLDEVID